MLDRFRIFAGLGAALLCLAGSAQAQLRRDWSIMPTTENFEAAFPSAAFAQQPSAHAICNADTEGALSDCITIDEWPSDRGLAEALIRMAPSYRLKPTSASCVTRFPRTLIHSMWTERSELALKHAPTVGDVRKYYPRPAAGPNPQGFAMVRCAVTAFGEVDACRVIYEEPNDLGFGVIAMKIAKKHKFAKPPSYDPANPPSFTMPINIVADPGAARRCGVW